MRRTSISPLYIYTLSLGFVNSSLSSLSYPTRGRPREYHDALILTIATLKELFGFSYREALEFAKWFWKDIPSLSDFHYRLSCFNSYLLESFISFLADKLIKAGFLPDKYILDGTGWSYRDCYPLKLLRGKEVRLVQSHVRTVALVGVAGRKRFVLAALSGKAYARVRLN